MEQESSKIPTSRRCFKWERIRTLLWFAVVTCLLTCIAFQFIFLVSMHRKLEDVDTQLRGKESRLATIESELRVVQDKERNPRSQWEGRLTIAENKIEAIFQTLKHGKWEQTTNHARQKRTTNPQVNLSDLGKRVIAVESRIVELSKDLSLRSSFRGRDGRDGMPGPPGPAGRDGRDGRQGPAGPRGLTGPKGNVGPTGIPGPVGPSGPKGERGAEGQALSGVTYNRWGRTNCSGDASVVYTGVMGSGFYNHPGGGSNFVCLPENPVYDKYIQGWQGTGAIYGTEYQPGNFPGFSKNLNDQDAPCAVCYVRSRGSQVMIPATNKCPSGWTKEYHGYLMTEHYNHKHTSEFVCIDVDAEAVPGSHSNTNGALLYLVQVDCGYGIPCVPYVQEKELTCVVCTK